MRSSENSLMSLYPWIIVLNSFIYRQPGVQPEARPQEPSLTLARLPPFMTSGKPQSASQLALAHLADATVMTHCVIVTCCYQYTSVGVDTSVLVGGLALLGSSSLGACLLRASSSHCRGLKSVIISPYIYLFHVALESHKLACM